METSVLSISSGVEVSVTSSSISVLKLFLEVKENVRIILEPKGIFFESEIEKMLTKFEGDATRI